MVYFESMNQNYVIFIFLAWALIGLIYGVFFCSLKALHGFSILYVCSLLLFGGAKIYLAIEHRAALKDQNQVVSDFNPESIAPTTIKPFKALYKRANGVKIADFTAAGPDLRHAIDVVSDIEKIVYDRKNEIYYGLNQSGQLGKINLTNGRFGKKIKLDPSLSDDNCRIKDVAFDPENHEIIILTSCRGAKLFSYNIDASEWRVITQATDDDELAALTYSLDDKVLYALKKRHDAKFLSSIMLLNRNGDHIADIKISPQIPIDYKDEEGTMSGIQMKFSSGKIALILPPVYLRQEDSDKTGIFIIDPHSGEVFIAGKGQEYFVKI